MARYSDTVVDQFGNAVSGVQVSVYPRATPSVLASLTDDDGNVLGNPVATDADGLFYFNADEDDYILSFKLASATRPFHSETVNLNDAIRSALAGPSGASLVNATRSGITSPTIRTQQDRNERDQIPLLDFCSGSESQDASPGIARWIAKILELNGDGIVPAGDYRQTDTASVLIEVGDTMRSFNVRGMGNGGRFIWDGGNNKPMLHLRGTGGAGWKSKIRFENFRLFGNSFTGGEFSGVTGIQLGDSPENVFSGICNPCFQTLTFEDLSRGVHGLYESDEVTIFDCYFERYADIAIYNQHGGSNWNILANHLYEGGVASTGIRSSLASTRAIGNTIQGTGFAVGIQIDGGTTNRGQSPTLIGNYIESQQLESLEYAIALYGVQGGSLATNIFKGCPGANALILLEKSGSMPCRNIDIMGHTHHVSGGALERYIYSDPASVNCKILGDLESYQEDGTPGVFTIDKIDGAFTYILQDGTIDLTGALQVDGTQVIGNRGAAVADATDAASAITQLNALLARCRAHGLIAS